MSLSLSDFTTRLIESGLISQYALDDWLASRIVCRARSPVMLESNNRG
jgi:hypothetical protein